MRDITAAVDSAVQAEHVPMLAFVEMQFASATVRVCSAFESVPWNGFTWLGLGNLGSIEPIEESNELQMNGIGLQLSGVNPALISTALGEQYQGRRVNIWFAPLAKDVYLELPGTGSNDASTPDSAANSITTNIDVRVKAAATDWTHPTRHQTLASKYDSVTDSEWLFQASIAGAFQCYLRQSGNASFYKGGTVHGFVDGKTYYARFTVDFAAGKLRFYTSTDGVTYTQLGADVTITETAFAATAVSLDIGGFGGGGDAFAGKIYYAEIRNGIDGTVVAKFDPENDWQSNTPTSMVSSGTGEVWTINQSGNPPARVLDRGHAVLADPIGPFRFRCDTMAIEKGKTATITLTAENRLADWDRARIRRWTHEDQVAEHPGDRFFEQIPELMEKEIIFGLAMTLGALPWLFDVGKSAII